MLPLDLDSLKAAFYTGNCHKWLCAPKGAAFLWVREDWRATIRPLVISHGANAPRTDRSRFLLEHMWTGTHDPTAFLSVPAAIQFLQGLPDVMRANHALCLEARDILCTSLGIEAPCPDDLLGSMATLPLPDLTGSGPKAPLFLDPLQEILAERHHIEVPVIHWPVPPHRHVRISAQFYNHVGQYRALADAIRDEISRVGL
jgi:isopenicillin-N epimerase